MSRISRQTCTEVQYWISYLDSNFVLNVQILWKNYVKKYQDIEICRDCWIYCNPIQCVRTTTSSAALPQSDDLIIKLKFILTFPPTTRVLFCSIYLPN